MSRLMSLLCLARPWTQRELLIDQKELVSAAKDGIVVLQTEAENVAVPYFIGATTVMLQPRQSTQHIIAGLATAFGGLAAPTQRISRPLGRAVEALDLES